MPAENRQNSHHLCPTRSAHMTCRLWWAHLRSVQCSIYAGHPKRILLALGRRQAQQAACRLHHDAPPSLPRPRHHANPGHGRPQHKLLHHRCVQTSIGCTDLKTTWCDHLASERGLDTMIRRFAEYSRTSPSKASQFQAGGRPWTVQASSASHDRISHLLVAGLLPALLCHKTTTNPIAKHVRARLQSTC
jgi:hypothetical protein